MRTLPFWIFRTLGVQMAREEDRKPLAMRATCKIEKRRHDVALTNLSRKGCRIETFGLALSVGQSVVVQPEGLERVLGTVRWVVDQFAGIEFDYRLHPAVVDHLCRAHPDSD